MNNYIKTKSVLRSAFYYPFLPALLFLFIPFSGQGLAQVTPPPPPSAVYDLDFLDTYKDAFPFSASKALAVDESIPNVPICFMGSGGGVYVLNISLEQPITLDVPGGLGNKLKTDGFVWDLTKRHEATNGLIRVFCAPVCLCEFRGKQASERWSGIALLQDNLYASHGEY